MNDAIMERLEISNATIVGREGLPFWTIVHFFEKTICNHLKLTTIQRICELSAQGVLDSHFVIGSKSIDVYQQEKIEIDQFKDYIILESNSRDPENFWKLIHTLKRPIVFYDNGLEKIPLYDFANKDACRLTDFSENSPFTANFEGAGGALVDLFYAKEREERARREHINRQIGQIAENVERIVRASQVIENPNTPPGVRRYAIQTMEKIMKAQETLNEKIGITDVHIDSRG